MNDPVHLSRQCPTEIEWRALLAQDLPPDRAAEMEAHLDGCLACHDLLNKVMPALPAWLGDVGRDDTVPRAWVGYWQKWADVRPKDEPADDAMLPFLRTGNYELKELIGRGGMGDVYKVWNVKLRRYEAIKVLHPRVRRSPTAIAMFKEEAQRLARLEHTNIVRVYSTDEQGGAPYFSMELVDGPNLAAVIREAPIAAKDAARLVQKIASDIHYAHSADVLHLDLKPSNILMTRDGVPKVSDFGLSKLLRDPAAHAWIKGAGTPEYMAPEQWAEDSRDVGEATDVYGLGTILYELLVGAPPVERSVDRDETRRRVLFDEPIPPGRRRRGIPRDLESICLRCLRKRPEERYGSAEEVSEALNRFIEVRHQKGASWFNRLAHAIRRRPGLASAACAALVIIGTISTFLIVARWHQQLSDARGRFAKGQQQASRGQVSAGFKQMQEAQALLPYFERQQRDHFTTGIAAWKAILNSEKYSHGHDTEVTAAGASPDGRYVLFGDANGATYLWDLTGGAPKRLSAGKAGRPVLAVAFNRDGTLCAAAGCDTRATVWDVRSEKSVAECRLDFYVRCLAFVGGDGDLLVTGTGDPVAPLRRWKVLRGEAREMPLIPSGLQLEQAIDIVVSPKGDRFVSTTFPSHCHLWNSETGDLLADWTDAASPGGQPVPPKAVFSDDTSQLLVAGSKLTTRDGLTGGGERTLDAGGWSRVHGITFLDDGQASIVADVDQASFIRRGHPEMKGWSDIPMDRIGDQAGLAVVTDRGHILAGIGTKTIRLLQPAPRDLRFADLGADLGRAKVVVSKDATRVVTLTRPEWVLPAAGQPINRAQVPAFHRSRLQAWDGSLRSHGPAIEFAKEHIPEVVALDATGDKIAVGCSRPPVAGSRAAVLLVTPAHAGAVTVCEIDTFSSAVMAIAFADDGKKLFAGSTQLPGAANAQLACWTIRDGAQELDWKISQTSGVTALAVSPDGRRLAVGGVDKRLRVYLTDERGRAPIEHDAGGPIVGLSFSRDGRFLAIAQLDSRVRVLEVSERAVTEKAHLDHPDPDISVVAFSPTDDLLYVRCRAGIYRWDARVWEPIDPPIRFVDRVMDFSPIAKRQGVIAITSGGSLVLHATHPSE